MREQGSCRFKVADEPWEFEQIHRLNYRTFVEEIPQHPPNGDGRLVDRFHHENTYLIALAGERLVGMLAVRHQRPFSLDEKLEGLDGWLPPHRGVCEVRLLAVDPEHRGGRVFQGLMCELERHCRATGCDLAVASGTVRQLKLYEHLGFVAFGPRVGTQEASYQPMYLSQRALEAHCGRLLGERRSTNVKRTITLQTGPTTLRPEVERAFSAPSRSHRSREFARDFEDARRRLCQMTGARGVEILTGSATAANDAIAGQLSLASGRGLILSNGEFGERLIDHGRRWGLAFEPVSWSWGELFDADRIRRALDAQPETGWLWAAHCETSTGVLNDLAMLGGICRDRGIKLCLDAVSSLGAVELDLTGVWLASGTSGKALGSYAGLALVFHEDLPSPQPTRLPRCLDLGFYAAEDGVPFTLNSNLVDGLCAALKRFDQDDPFGAMEEEGRWLQWRLRTMGYNLVAPEEAAAPMVTTIALPPAIDSRQFGDDAREAGLLLGYESGYLLRRNWVQICLMGAIGRPELEEAVAYFERRSAAMPERATTLTAT